MSYVKQAKKLMSMLRDEYGIGEEDIDHIIDTICEVVERDHTIH